tara:strand:- start:1869 stop:4439 length:2571 start_codon:yes stop_codon:yes gene_type:complete
MATDQFGNEIITGVGSDVDQFGNPVLLQDNRTIGPSIEEDPEDASGIGNALLAGLTNSEENQVFWLAAKRFPEQVEKGNNPAEFYALDESGDLFYRDPYSGAYKKEFADDIFGFDIDYLDNLGPVGQFLGEVVGGTMGLTSGFMSGGFPGAAVGGAKGTAVGGGTAYAVRAGLSEALGGPPLDVEKAAKDLAFSSAFGAIPFGVPTKSAPKTLKFIFDKFPGTDGRTILADIVQNGGRTVDEKLEYMSRKYPDISLSRAEANELVGNAGYKAEAFINKNARNETLVQHYNDRNERIAYHAENFFEQVISGKLAAGGIGKKLTGPASADAELDIARAAELYIEAEKKKLATQVAPLYREAYDMDVAIDVSDIIKQIDEVIGNPNASAEKISAYKKMKVALTDSSIGDSAPRQSTELLHEGLKDNFNRLLSSLTKDADSSLKREVTLVKNQVSNRLKEANPLYKNVTQVYDDAFGTAQTLDRSIVGQFANVAGFGEKASRITKKLFSGNIKPREIQELKAIMQSTDDGAKAWQNLKGTWLSTQWDEVITQGGNPLGQPNKFLRAMGIQSPSRAFPKQANVVVDAGGMQLPASADELARLADEVAEYQVKGRKAKMWEAVLEPDELKSFIDLTSLMEMVSRIQTQAGSDTFGNLTIDAILARESQQVMGQGVVAGSQQAVRSAGGIITALASLPSRVTGKGFKDLMANINRRQKEAYMDLLISHIVDGSKRVSLDAIMESVKPASYLISQTFARGGVEGLTGLFNNLSQDERKQQFIERGDEVIEEQQQDNQQELSGQIDVATPTALNLPLFEDMPQNNLGEAPSGFDASMSPTILPSASDREIAMRMNAKRSGIGSLV